MDDQPLGRVTIVGVGDAGSAAVDRIIAEGVNRVQCIAVNTYAGALSKSKAATRLLIGEHTTRGLGAGGSPDMGRKAAEENAQLLFKTLEGADTIFVVCGIGGGTGTGAAPVIAGIGRELHAQVIAVASLPFTLEGSHRQQIAQFGLSALKAQTDKLTVISGDNLLKWAIKDAPMRQAYILVSGALAWGVIGHLT
jgi:cell division protein FtsZ